MIRYIKDEDEELVIPCGLGPVVCYDSESETDWVVKARLGLISDLSGYILPEPSRNNVYHYLLCYSDITSMPDMSSWRTIDYTHAAARMFMRCPNLEYVYFPNLESICYHNPDKPGIYGGATEMFKGCNNIRRAEFPNLRYVGTVADSYYDMDSMFYGCSKLEYISFPKLEYIVGVSSAGSMFRYCEKLKNVEFPSLREITTWYDDGSSAAFMFADCRLLETASFPELGRLGGANCLSNMFTNCINLTSVSMPKAYIGTGDAQTFVNMFVNCPKLTDLNIGVGCVQNSADQVRGRNIVTEACINRCPLTNITLNGTPDDTWDVNFSACSGISKDSVLQILSHLSQFERTVAVKFYDGLIFTDYEDGRLQTAYDEVIAAGWTITGLTITPYS